MVHFSDRPITLEFFSKIVQKILQEKTCDKVRAEHLLALYRAGVFCLGQGLADESFRDGYQKNFEKNFDVILVGMEADRISELSIKPHVARVCAERGDRLVLAYCKLLCQGTGFEIGPDGGLLRVDEHSIYTL